MDQTQSLPKYQAVLWGTGPDGYETVLSNRAENILAIIPMARRDGFTDLRISIFEDGDLPDFVRTVTK